MTTLKISKSVSRPKSAKLRESRSSRMKSEGSKVSGPATRVQPRRCSRHPRVLRSSQRCKPSNSKIMRHPVCPAKNWTRRTKKNREPRQRPWSNRPRKKSTTTKSNSISFWKTWTGSTSRSRRRRHARSRHNSGKWIASCQIRHFTRM